MAKIFYARVDEFWRREEKYAFLDEKQHRGNIEWQEITPDAIHNWLTEGLRDEFDHLVPFIATDQQSVFRLSSNGIKTNRDAWAYNFNSRELEENLNGLVETFNQQLNQWNTLKTQNRDIDEFTASDETRISWSESLKHRLLRGSRLDYDTSRIRQALYRPFTQTFIYFDPSLCERLYQFPAILPISSASAENKVIALSAIGSTKPFHSLMTTRVPDIHLTGDTACFPFYTYDEDGSNRRENITDWALEQFRSHYKNRSITKLDIFHYVYAVLHHPLYRERYAANLKRELPRIPFAPDFKALADIGKRLAEIHVNYEQQPEYLLERIEAPGKPLDWRVEKMKLSKDKRSIIYNDFLTLAGIPPEVFEYRLGNRSALEWIIDQYQVSTDKRSGITNDPNRDADPEYIVRLIGQVVTVSQETVKFTNLIAESQLVESV